MQTGFHTCMQWWAQWVVQVGPGLPTNLAQNSITTLQKPRKFGSNALLQASPGHSRLSPGGRHRESAFLAPRPRHDVGTSDRHSRAPPLPAARHRRERLPHLASRPTPARPTPAAPPAPPVHRRPAPDASSHRPLAPHGGRCHQLHRPGRLAAWPQPTGPCPTPGG